MISYIYAVNRTINIFAFAALLAAGCSQAQPGGRVLTSEDGTQWQQMTVEQLPDLSTPRGSHRTLVFGEEVVVLGGHTDGFKPVETAEYYAGGAWHTIRMLYTHENGFAAPLPDGRILLGGGSPEAFGIGQSWGAEVYDPGTHAFTAVGIMAVKRSMSSALTMPDGSVIIVGNWHAPDSWETWTPEGGFVSGGQLAPGWAEPHVLPASRDDIIVFGPWDTMGGNTGGRVEHLEGTTEYVPLLEEWWPGVNYYVFPDETRIADYTYLVPLISRSGPLTAILKGAAGKFSLLEMEKPLPTLGPDGNLIGWSHLQVDRPARLIWAQGLDVETGRLYLARIAYDATFDGGKAAFTLYYADVPEGFASNCAKLMPGGRFVLAGGTNWKRGEFPVMVDNFKTSSEAYILYTEPVVQAGVPLWTIVLLAVVLCGLVVWIIVRRRREATEAAPAETVLPRNMMEQITAVIEEKELYRRKNLRITDVATELATNKTYVSVLLNNMSGESFTQLLTRYRVRYAQKLLREQPEMLLDEIAEESGFSSRTTFFRNFKALTGMTPLEWRISK